MAKLTSYASVTTLNEGMFFFTAIDTNADGTYESRRVSLASLRTALNASAIPDSASAVGYTLNTLAFTTAGAKLLSVQNDGSEKLSVNKDGQLSCLVPFGSLYVSSAAATTLSATTPTKAAGTTAAAGQAAEAFTVATTNRLTYTGLVTENFFVTATVDVVKTAGSATVGHLHIYKNGAAITGLEVTQTLADTTDNVHMSLSGVVELETDDYVEIWVETVNGDNLTVQNGTLTAYQL